MGIEIYCFQIYGPSSFIVSILLVIRDYFLNIVRCGFFFSWVNILKSIMLWQFDTFGFVGKWGNAQQNTNEQLTMPDWEELSAFESLCLAWWITMKRFLACMLAQTFAIYAKHRINLGTRGEQFCYIEKKNSALIANVIFKLT